MREQGLSNATSWPVWNIARAGGSRRTRARGIVVLAMFLAWPVWAAVRAVQLHAGPVRVAVVVVTVVYGASWIVAMAYGISRPPRERMLLLGWLFALGVGLAVLLADPADLGYLAYALTAAVWLLPTRWGLLSGLAVITAQLIALWAATGSVEWNAALALVPSTVTPAAVVLLIRLLIQLSQAREEIEMLATAAERSRLARDLHDVLGHSLTTITVKTGLARRMLESGADREQAVAELRDVEELSRQAHSEIRAAVSGYRRPSLAVELVGARAALRAAGIEAALPPAVDHVLADLREPFAYVLREGVTNVIRHSGAMRCEIRLGDSSLEISDDGRPSTLPYRSGNGLSGLAERLRAVDGQIEAGPLPQGGFRLHASRS